MNKPSFNDLTARANKSGLAMPGQPGPAGMQPTVMIGVDQHVGAVIGERHILRVAAALYLDSKRAQESQGIEITEPGQVLDMMNQASMEALALFDAFNETVRQWGEAREQAQAQFAAEAEAQQTPEEAATEGGVDLSSLAEAPA